MVDSLQEYSEEHILSAILASTKPNESQIAKIGMMHNSKVGHFGLERTLKRLKDQNDVWQFQRQHIRHFIDECASEPRQKTTTVFLIEKMPQYMYLLMRFHFTCFLTTQVQLNSSTTQTESESTSCVKNYLKKFTQI